MEVNVIILIVSTAVSIVGIVYSVIATILKSKKTKSVKLAQIMQTLPSYIKEAETVFGGNTGAAKLVYVLNKVCIDCIKNHLDYNQDDWTVEIEEILSTPQKKEV